MADSNIVDIKLRDTILKLSDDLKEIVTEIAGANRDGVNAAMRLL
jgi:hypothetical protein